MTALLPTRTINDGVSVEDGSGMRLELNDLRECNEFLNAVIDNINSAVFIVDDELRIQQFNKTLQALFEKEHERIASGLCGNAFNCTFAVVEQSECGKTSHCARCELRGSILRVLRRRESSRKIKMVREFFIQDEPVTKHLELSAKHIHFEGREMALVIVDDVTESETQKLELMEKQKHIEKDLQAAAGIQQSLLPRRLPRIPNLEFAWKFLPCDVIGGDIFNVFSVDADHVGAYMLDVSGHGVPSALVTVSVSQALQPSAPICELTFPEKVCEALDQEYPIERFNTFFSLVYIIMNVREGRIVYSNAGHPPVVLLHNDGEIELLTEGGGVIGLGGLLPFSEASRDLREGDRIILYTDGVVEHRNAAGEFYGQERLYGMLSRFRDLGIEEMLSRVLESVTEFGGDERLRDDVSLLGIHFKGRGGRRPGS
ncbi:MAG: SpoIIE family protein phosphatase [Syntrophobacteraceae bacterium]|nr:SpoIIE family protein phosphatase [Syntrophobacteraceae bacterium]